MNIKPHSLDEEQVLYSVRLATLVFERLFFVALRDQLRIYLQAKVDVRFLVRPTPDSPFDLIVGNDDNVDLDKIRHWRSSDTPLESIDCLRVGFVQRGTINTNDFFIRVVPTCGSSQSGAEALLQIVLPNDISPEAIERLTSLAPKLLADDSRVQALLITWIEESLRREQRHSVIASKPGADLYALAQQAPPRQDGTDAHDLRLRGFVDRYEGMFKDHESGLRVPAAESRYQFFNLFATVRARSWNAATAGAHRTKLLLTKSQKNKLDEIFGDVEGGRIRAACDDLSDISSAMSSFDDGSPWEFTASIGPEHLIWKALWSDTNSQFFYVPVHVGGTPWLLLFTKLTNAEPLTKHYFYSMIAMFAPQLRRAALTSYLEELLRAFRLTLNEKSAVDRADSIVQTINSLWAQIGFVFPYAVPELVASNYRPADKPVSERRFLADLGRRDDGDTTLWLYLDLDRRTFRQEIDSDPLPFDALLDGCKSVLSTHGQVRAKITETSAYDLVHPLSMRLNEMLGDASRLREYCKQNHRDDRALLRHAHRVEANARCCKGFVNLLFLLHAADVDGAPAVYTRRDKKAGKPRFCTDQALDLTRCLHEVVASSFVGEMTSVQVRLSEPLPPLVIRPYRMTEDLGHLRLNDGIYQEILLELCLNAGYYGKTTHNPSGVELALRAEPRAHVFGHDDMRPPLVLVFGNGVDEERARALSDEYRLTPSWSLWRCAQATGLTFISMALQKTEAGTPVMVRLTAPSAMDERRFEVAIGLGGLTNGKDYVC